jgi:NADP-dependent 3-hydroxy acid dehydrogenase YdfG
MNKFLNNKIIVVTGASSGIGEAMAREYAKAGAKVMMAARREEELKRIAAEITTAGGKVAYCACDVVSEEECKNLIAKSVEVFGGIDILICNAGLSMRALFDECDLKVLHRLMDVNFWGAVNCVKYALPHIQKSKGSIVGISSVAGIHGLPGRTGYSASKYALTGFLDTIRIENLKKGVHVMTACPGFTASNVRFSALTADGSQQGETPRNEDKMMTPEQVAHIVARGIRRRKRLCLMEWEGRGTHLLKKFFPALVDRLFYAVMAQEPDSPIGR